MVYPPLFTVYTTPACVQCTATKRRLDALQKAGKIGAYLVTDLTDPANEGLLNRFKEDGYTKAPIVTVTHDEGNGSHVVDTWVGYDPDRIDSHVVAA